MWMAEFCRRAGLTRDAVRFYVRLGLLKPTIHPGNRYQDFGEADVERVALIRTAQRVGFTLAQIVPLSREFDAGRLDKRRRLELMRGQLAMLDAQAIRLQAMRDHVRAKIAWMENGERGVAPAYRPPEAQTGASARQRAAMRIQPRPRAVARRTQQPMT